MTTTSDTGPRFLPSELIILRADTRWMRKSEYSSRIRGVSLFDNMSRHPVD